MTESLERHNRMIERANARIQQLQDAGLKVQASLGAQGVTITIERPSFKGRNYVSRSCEIIPY